MEATQQRPGRERRGDGGEGETTTQFLFIYMYIHIMDMVEIGSDFAP